ncbi:MAG: HigA family addiction module antitoxin [Chloroflexi bacterium]|nr:HigA family addiction module antitoxin [Chloroflexota bacterium]
MMKPTISPVHPGKTLLEEFLNPWGISQNRLAQHMGIPVSRLNEIIRGRRGMTGDTALRLGMVTHTTPEFWLSLQALYDLEIAKDAVGERLKKEVTPYPWEENRHPE